ncbi:ABC transporter permease [Salininema proteolyticum]|uniref:ABC transporter permease n=1 Tax=Salininema proteolyticum TaxID=1607685 RepID=A0ABV8U460_9ACTN
MAQRKGRLILTSLAIVLGTMFVSAAMVLTSSLNQALAGTFSNLYEDVDYVVQPGDGDSADIEGGSTSPSDLLPAELTDDLQDVSGVTDATGEVSGTVSAIGDDGKLVGQPQPTIGFNAEALEGFAEITDGRAPEADGEVMVSAKFISESGYEVGDEAPVYSPTSESSDYEIVGAYEYPGGRDSLIGETAVAFTTPDAQALMAGGEDVYTTISVAGDADKADLQSVVGDAGTVKTGAEADEDNAEAFSAFTDIINWVFLGFGAVAIIVSVFLILNTFTIVVAQRQKELALMRSMGASTGQATRSVLVEALLVGAVASVVGFGIGILLGMGLSSLVGNTLFEGLTVETVVPAGAYSAIGIGIIVTLLAALSPARRAAKIPPVAAMRDAANPPKSLRGITIAGSIVTAAGLGLMIAGLREAFDSGNLPATFTGVGLTFIGAILLTPILSRPLTALLGRIMGFGLSGKLGRLNAARNPRRTAITASALMISVALVTAIASIVSSLKASAEQTMEDQVSSDLIIGGAQMSETPPSFESATFDEVAALPDVDEAVDVYADPGAKAGDKELIASSSSDIPALFDLTGQKLQSGSVSGFGDDDVVISDFVAEEIGAEQGDTITVTFFDGTTADLEIAAVTEDGGAWVSDAYTEHFMLTRPTSAYLTVMPGADVAEVRDQVDEVLANEPEVGVYDNAEFLDQQLSGLDNMIIAVQVLMGLAIIIAVIGVVNTLVLSILERTREIGMLRAVGMTRGQLRRMVTVESLIICLFGAVMGIGVGVGLGFAIQQGFKDNGIDIFALPWNLIATYLIAALVVGFLAALAPAARAAKLNALRAIATE